jgi:hypothetical protein
MKLETFKNGFKYAFFPGLLMLSPVAYAQCDAIALSNGDPRAIGCIITRGLNILLLAVGVVFVIMLLYGSFKASMALGDPKGLTAAKDTWLNAIIGLLVVIFAFAVFAVITSIFGISGFLGLGDVVASLTSAITDLYAAFDINL